MTDEVVRSPEHAAADAPGAAPRQPRGLERRTAALRSAGGSCFARQASSAGGGLAAHAAPSEQADSACRAFR